MVVSHPLVFNPLRLWKVNTNVKIKENIKRYLADLQESSDLWMVKEILEHQVDRTLASWKENSGKIWGVSTPINRLIFFGSEQLHRTHHCWSSSLEESRWRNDRTFPILQIECFLFINLFTYLSFSFFVSFFIL